MIQWIKKLALSDVYDASDTGLPSADENIKKKKIKKIKMNRLNPISRGYAEGYATAQTSNNNNNNNNNNLSPRDNGAQSNGVNPGPGGSVNQDTIDQILGGQPSPGQESSSVTTGDSPWKEFGVFIGPIQRHTGVFHNENGVFIPWAKLCSSVQSYLLESCSSLINPDGSLTTAGDKAVGCITNGAILTIAAKKYLGMQTDQSY